VGVAQAQIHHIDYTTMNPQFSTNPMGFKFTDAQSLPGSASTLDSKWMSQIDPSWLGKMNSFGAGQTPGMNEYLGSQRFSTGPDQRPTYSPFNGKTAPNSWQSSFPRGDNLPMKMAPVASTRRPQMSDMFKTDPNFNQFDTNNQWQHAAGPSKYTDAFVFHANDNGQQLASIDQELSMQDVNRYQFHSSNSSEPGLNITHAGGGQVEVTGGSLNNTPGLFDFKSTSLTTPTSEVRSGGPVAPRIITSQGSLPYSPTREGSLPATPLTVQTQAPRASSSPYVAPYSRKSAAAAPVMPGIQIAPAKTPAPSLIPQGTYLPPRDGVNTPVEYGPKQIWVDIDGEN
jgi:hypothetical protein